MIQSRTGMSVEAGQNQAKDCDFSLHFNPQVKGHVKQVLEAKFALTSVVVPACTGTLWLTYRQ